jgi:hypothetical protein
MATVDLFYGFVYETKEDEREGKGKRKGSEKGKGKEK